MIKLSVCIEPLWKDLSPEEKIMKVKEIGFPAFEFWGWKNKDIEKIKRAKEETGIELSAFCMEPNSLLTEDAPSINELIEGLKESIRIAKILDCKRLIVTTGNALYEETFEITRRKVVRKLKELIKVAEENDIILLLEPLNPIVNHKGYWLTKTKEAVDIIEEIGSSNLKILYDIYHQQITEGNIIATIQKYISLIGHFHSAGVPGRHELTGGELNYKNIFLAIEKTGYSEYIGLEFFPTNPEEVSLKEILAIAQSK